MQNAPFGGKPVPRFTRVRSDEEATILDLMGDICTDYDLTRILLIELGMRLQTMLEHDNR